MRGNVPQLPLLLFLLVPSAHRSPLLSARQAGRENSTLFQAPKGSSRTAKNRNDMSALMASSLMNAARAAGVSTSTRGNPRRVARMAAPHSRINNSRRKKALVTRAAVDSDDSTALAAKPFEVRKPISWASFPLIAAVFYRRQGVNSLMLVRSNSRRWRLNFCQKKNKK